MKATLANAVSTTGDEPPASAVDFSKLHGFNLLGMFNLEWSNGGYREEEFRIVRDFGFNFVRLPIDYRTYTEPDNRLAFDEKALQKIDAAVDFGQRYGVHVCLNLHRAPGFTVAKPPEPSSLWQDPEMQRAFLAHWEMFAERYKDVPADALSFNLVNEPAGVEDAEYGEVVRPVIAAIRRYRGDRAIVSDGLFYGGKPSASIADTAVVQALRGYSPFHLTHYKASWVEGSDSWPEPVWPPKGATLSAFFYGSYKPDMRTPLEIRHRFPAGSKLGITVHQVSHRLTLRVRTRDAVIWEKSFVPGPGSGEWSRVVYSDEWQIYKNIYDRSYDVTLPATDSLVIEGGEGDWLTISELTLQDGTRKLSFVPDQHAFGSSQVVTEIGADGKLVAIDNRAPTGSETLYKELEPWLSFRASGGRIFVGELGVHNRTPHPVVLAWMEDLLSIYRAQGIGWALWNLYGSFGVLDSGRSDVRYVDYRGHQLDERLLTLVQKYR